MIWRLSLLWTPADDARVNLENALRASKTAQTLTRRDFIYAYLGLAHLKAGDFKQATDATEKGLHIAMDFGYKEGHPLCTEILGRIAVSQGDTALALILIQSGIFCSKYARNMRGTHELRYR